MGQLLLKCCEMGQSFLKYSANKDGNTGTRVAMINILKQITSRIDEKYGKDIEKKENYYKAKEYKMDDSDDSDQEDECMDDVDMDKQQVNGNIVNKKEDENEVLHPMDDNDTNEFLEMLD